MRRIIIGAVIGATLATGATAVAHTLAHWVKSTRGVATDSDAPNRRANLLLAVNIVPDAEPPAATEFKTPDGGTQHVTGWRTYDLAAFGVPSTAKAVTLGVKTVVTKGNLDADAVIFMHARAHGSTCCPGGDPGHPDLPVDGNYGNPVQAMIAQGAAHLAHDGVRGIAEETVPVRDGKIDVSYGWRSYDPTDGLGLAVYVNGYDS